MEKAGKWTVILKERAGLNEWRLLFLAWDNVLWFKYKRAWKSETESTTWKTSSSVTLEKVKQHNDG